MWKVIAISAGIVGIIWIIVGGPSLCFAADPPTAEPSYGAERSMRQVTADKIRSLPVTNVADILRTRVGITVRPDEFRVCGTDIPDLTFTAQPKPAPSWQMLDFYYLDGGSWPPGMDGEPSELDFDLNDDGDFDLLDVVTSIDEATED